MPAKKLAFVAIFADEKEEVTVGGAHVERFDFGVGVRAERDLEELAPVVGAHVERDGNGGAAEPGRGAVNLSRAPIRSNFVERKVVSMCERTR